MLGGFTQGAEHIYIACNFTDFRKQIDGLVALVSMKFKLDPYSSTCVFLFCNKKRDCLKALRFEKDGFLMATNKLMKDMKFQWPMKTDEIKDITPQQVRWLLEGLEIEQKKAHKSLQITLENTCF
jgi:transposase